MEVYKSVSDYTMKKFGTVGYDTDHTLKYSSIVKDLDFEACKEILLMHITYDDLLDAYSKDKNLNNILNKHYYCKDVLPNLIRTADKCWQWDTIGYKMLHNRKATVKFKLISLADLTCIAKACARMAIKNGSEV